MFGNGDIRLQFFFWHDQLAATSGLVVQIFKQLTKDIGQRSRQRLNKGILAVQVALA